MPAAASPDYVTPPGLAGVAVASPPEAADQLILSPPALGFVAWLHRQFVARRAALLRARADRQRAIDAGENPDFPAETADLRLADWQVTPAPADLRDRRVEITGPVDRKMIINALNAPVQTFMADFEDSCSPTWANVVGGQRHLRDAVRRTISFEQPGTGKIYRLNPRPAVLMVRPRGWHLEERHMQVDGAPVPAALFDFGLYLFHNAGELSSRGTGPYFYLPKLEGRHEARLWNDVFVAAQRRLELPVGTIRATVLIETILAAFEMDEILHELRDHITGLNCGRWDYIFSFIKKFRARRDFVLPDRSLVTMDQPFLRAYVELLIRTCHRRGAHAMGGMAAQIPIRDDPAANAAAMDKVRADKRREALAGHDGTWIAHPGLAGVARDAFAAVFTGPNQLDRPVPENRPSAADLLQVPAGPVTEEGVRHNVRVGVRYLEAWLGGNGCVPLYNLMEDAATAEISRAQLWQWLHHAVRLSDGRTFTRPLFRALFAEERRRIATEVGPATYDAGRFGEAEPLFAGMVEQDVLDEFLTLPAYALLP